MNHIPVMIDNVLYNLPARENAIFLDCTFGAGGYSEKILANQVGSKVIALDCDASVEIYAERLRKKYGERFNFFHENFANLDRVLQVNDLVNSVDCIVMDLGFSSMQIDEVGRGFSILKNGPLDMRMDRHSTAKSAANFVNDAAQGKIVDVLKYYGEEKNAKKIADAIVSQRAKKSFKETVELASLIEDLFGGRGKIHPATKTFQALRIYVNNEIDNLVQGILHAACALNNKGRLIIVSFHGLECRVIKHVFRALVAKQGPDLRFDWSILKNYDFQILTKKAIVPSHEEVKNNIRARSAKMRILEKVER